MATDDEFEFFFEFKELREPQSTLPYDLGALPDNRQQPRTYA